ncbi:MAG: 2-oxoglutarate dehydrogenase E1 component, partial [Deltaproteobacteria bacterium]|nr:2-oxoglutarate dehydrogenase E1 component [Deltaproteobacteria bacterium]
MTVPGAFNADYIDRQYALWKEDAGQVGADWRLFFEGFELGASGPSPAACTPDDLLRQSRVEALIAAYRENGHLLACLDPLVECPRSHPLLEPSTYGLTETDLDREVYAPDFSPDGRARLRDVLEVLQETYCGCLGVEYVHVQDPEERRWLRERMESSRNRPDLAAPDRLRVLELLCRSGRFEEFLHRTYLGQTRFSLEGADATIPLADALFSDAAGRGVREVIVGMAHRGRLNIEAHLLGCSY